MKIFNKLLILISAFLFIACNPSTIGEKPAVELYNHGLKDLKDTSWLGAVDNFIEIERQHPYSEYAARGLYLSGYAYYKEKQYNDAIVMLDRFLKLYPGNSEIPYALYLKSLCYYDQISDVKREQKYTSDALSVMQELQRRYPDSKYTKAVENKIKILKNFLIAKEMNKAKELVKQQNFVAGLRRYQGILTTYPQSYMTEESLFRIVEIYTILGMKNDAKKTVKILELNYPDDNWTKLAKKLIK